MPREASGELRRLADGWEARVTLQKRERLGLELPFTHAQEKEAAERCKLLAGLAQRLRKAGQLVDAPMLLKMAASAQTSEKLRGVVEAIDALCTVGGTELKKTASTLSFEDLGDDWTSGKLAKEWPDHVPQKDTSDMDGYRLAKLNKVIGHVLMKDFRLEHAEAAMRALPTKRNGQPLSRSTRRQYAQCIGRLCGFAVYPLRLLAVSPIPKGWLPKPNARLKFPDLRPDEDAKLLAAPDEKVPLCYRLIFGFMHREGLRREEAQDLRWRNLDLTVDLGVIDLSKHKTDDEVTRDPWTLGPGVADMLRWWKEERGEVEPNDHVFVDEYDRPMSLDEMSRRVRGYLAAAGLDRPALTFEDKTHRHFGTHCFRRSFVTRSLALGLPNEWIRARTGHTNDIQLGKYRVAAKSLADLDLGDVLPLDLALGIPQENPTEGERKWRNWQTRRIQVPVPERA